MRTRAWLEGVSAGNSLLAGVVVLAALAGGCNFGPQIVPLQEQKPIDRQYVEYPAGTSLVLYATGLTGPTSLAFDAEGNMLVAEGGLDGGEARIYGFKPDPDRSYFEVFPRGRRFPFQGGFKIYGPVGGLVAAHGKIYVAHRDSDGRGVVTRFDYEGHHDTMVGDLPAQGDFGITDMAVAPNGRLYFGVGAATNSGVVGMDNMHWLRRNREVCDQAWTGDLGGYVFLNGWRFNTSNPFAGLFGGADVAVTAPFQAFGVSNRTRIARAYTGKPSAAIYSIDPDGGDLRIECHGIRYPAGLGFNEFGRLYVTNQGMKLRGTRPVMNDPDVLLKVVSGQWYGWPDFSANLLPIQEARFQPPSELLSKTGYPELGFLIDHGRSKLTPPAPRAENLLAAEFAPLSGATKFDFVPGSGSLARIRQNRNVAVVALSGDRAPYDTSGGKIPPQPNASSIMPNLPPPDTGGPALDPQVGPLGYKLVLVNVDTRQVENFVKNAPGGPASAHRKTGDPSVELERPYDVKFGPDGAMYILDIGRIEMSDGEPSVKSGTGRIYKLMGATPSTTKP